MPSDIINVVPLRRVGLLPAAVQRVHADVVAVPGGHSQGLARRIRVGDELTQLLLGNVHALGHRRVAHLDHGAQEVERV